MIRLFFEESLAAPATGSGGTSGVNRLIVEALTAAFDTAATPDDADCVVSTTDRIKPGDKRRVVIDHGAIADPSFWAERAVHLRPDDTIVVSSARCAEVIRRMIAPPRPAITVIPFAVTGTFSDLRARTSQLRAGLRDELGIPPSSRILLGVSSFDSRKNLHLGVRLLAALPEEAASAHYVLLGQNEHPPRRKHYAQYVRDRAIEEKVADRVHMIGSHPHERVLEIMAASDVLVHLTNCRMENFGLVVAEAMSCGLPVLAADWGGIGELVTEGENGFLAPTCLSDDGPRTQWRELLGPLHSLLTDHEARERVSRRAVRLAETLPTVESYQRGLAGAVRESAEAPIRENESHIRLTELGEEVRFMYYGMLFRGEETISGRTQMNELLSVRHGRLFRDFYGPIATRSEPPRPSGPVIAYPVVDYRIGENRIEVIDPAFTQALTASEAECELAAQAAAAGTVRTTGENVERLVKRGVLSVLPGVPSP